MLRLVGNQMRNINVLEGVTVSAGVLVYNLN